MCLALVWKSKLTLNPDIIFIVLVDAACDAVKTTSRLSGVCHCSWFAPARQTIYQGTCDLGLFPRFVPLRTFSLFSHLLLLSPHTKVSLLLSGNSASSLLSETSAGSALIERPSRWHDCAACRSTRS